MGPSEIGDLAKYYFDGGGKSVRPCIAMCVGHMANTHQDEGAHHTEKVDRQRSIAVVSEMIHTASLVHDDILDHAETRRGKASVNVWWDAKRSTMAGDYILGVGSRILSQVGDPDVVMILSQVLADLVQGEFMQLQNKDESERFEHYLSKSFNKTASLMAYSCAANPEVGSPQTNNRVIGDIGKLINDKTRPGHFLGPIIGSSFCPEFLIIVMSD